MNREAGAEESSLNRGGGAWYPQHFREATAAVVQPAPCGDQAPEDARGAAVLRRSRDKAGRRSRRQEMPGIGGAERVHLAEVAPVAVRLAGLQAAGRERLGPREVAF